MDTSYYDKMYWNFQFNFIPVLKPAVIGSYCFGLARSVNETTAPAVQTQTYTV